MSTVHLAWHIDDMREYRVVASSNMHMLYGMVFVVHTVYTEDKWPAQKKRNKKNGNEKDDETSSISFISRVFSSFAILKLNARQLAWTIHDC